MSNTVFVLGAGASAHCGTPMMGNFLEASEDLLRRGQVEEARQDFERVFNARGELQGVLSKAKLDTYNVEAVYAAFEMGRLLESLPGIKEGSEVEQLISSLRRVIGYTLERTTILGDMREGHPEAPDSYRIFAEIIEELTAAKRTCAVMTFNYDLGLDYAFRRIRMPVDYGLEDVADEAGVPYLKLHGSLNWGRCKKCNSVLVNTDLGAVWKPPGTERYVVNAISRLQELSCCEQKLEPEPYIVPPTWNKTSFHAGIRTVWQRAAQELKDAENIFVLGYSLPPTDFFFNYLFALGVDTRTVLRRFYVYDIDSAVEERFLDLLGSGVISKFLFNEGSFEETMSPPMFPPVVLRRPVPLRQVLFRD